MAFTFTLPDFYAKWPFQRTLNPHYESVAIESTKWVEGFRILDEKKQAVFNRSNFPLLVALAFPHVDRQHLRLASDFFSWVFLFDDLGEVSGGASLRGLVARLAKILRDPLKFHPMRRSIIENMATSYWSRSLEIASPNSAKQFAESMERYMEAVCQEAEDRIAGHVRTIDEYRVLRTKTIGAKPAFALLLLTVNLPGEVFTHPCFEALEQSAADLISLSNDVYSWNFERSHRTDDHNIVSIAIVEKNLDIQGAIDYVGRCYDEAAKKFLEDMKNVPSFSETIDPIVKEYVLGLANWVTAFLEWAFETERYFGVKGAEIKSHGVVGLVPKGTREATQLPETTEEDEL